MADFFVTPPQCTLQAHFRRRALKSSHFLASQADASSNPVLFVLI